MTMRHGGDQALATRRPTPRSTHVGLGPAFIDERQPGQAQIRLFVPPFGARLGHVGAGLLGCVERLFLLSGRLQPRSSTSDRCSPTPCGWPPTKPATRRLLHPAELLLAPRSRGANQSVWVPGDSVAAELLSAPCVAVGTKPWRRRRRSPATVAQLSAGFSRSDAASAGSVHWCALRYTCRCSNMKYPCVCPSMP